MQPIPLEPSVLGYTEQLREFCTIAVVTMVDYGVNPTHAVPFQTKLPLHLQPAPDESGCKALLVTFVQSIGADPMIG